MRLSKVQIKNFRSIADLTLNFDPPCRVLVGINESGKSNILNALSLLDEDVLPEKDDVRDIWPDETSSNESYVRFIFNLPDEERLAAYRSIEKNILFDDNRPIISAAEETYSLKEFFQSRNESLYIVNVKAKTKFFSCWALSTPKMVGAWKKPSKVCPANILITVNGEQVALNSFSLIEASTVDAIATLADIDPAYLSAVSTIDVFTLVSGAITEQIKDSLPSCVFWSYNDSNLLPGKVDLTSFASDPNICLPLKQMFALAGVTDVQTAIKEAQEKTNGLKNLLKRVGTRTTEHMHQVWKEYKGIQFQIVPDGTNISAAIQDTHNEYDLARRSDGFKRFVTFLLLVSAKAKTADLENTLYLHDEPEAGLHPSGARYLRDELIKIAEKNYVVYSTHSIFMIDKENVGRHLIVKKDKEITTAVEASSSTINDEEVVYNALGYSVFETLKPQNIIFEGWRDKRLFQVAVAKLPTQYKGLKDAFSDVGLTHAEGVKDIGRIASFIELANRNCIIISDADKPALEKQKQHKAEKKHGEWFTYDELLTNSITTEEDFIEPTVFMPILKKIKIGNPELPEFKVESLSIEANRLHIIQAWLEKAFPKDEVKTILNEIKEEIFNNLKPNQIEKRYYEFLKKLSSELTTNKNVTL